MIRRAVFSLVFLFCVVGLFAQQDIVENGYQVFYYPNGVKSSEGTMKNGKPDGFWKAYNKAGILISEGNRKNYLLDSLWKFYNDSGTIVMEVNYRNDKKHGIRKTWSEDEIVEETFSDNVKHGEATTYFLDGNVKKTSFFDQGYEHGIAKVYNHDGTIITLLTYKKGYLIDREAVNRTDSKGLQHGKWKWFYESGTLKKEGDFVHGVLQGYLKEYSEDGDLLKIHKYDEGEIVEDAPELQKLEIKTEYYANGKPKIIASYKDDVPEGVRREYDTVGTIVAAYIFRDGFRVGEGLIDEAGVRDGAWKEYYKDGSLKITGRYIKGKPVGHWIFYHKNGEIEQEGSYTDNGEADGLWTWYFDNGKIRREENYYLGMKDGASVEYDHDGVVLAQGKYVDDLENGEWFYRFNDHIQKGSYRNGKRYGLWQYFDNEGNLYFKGKYIDGNPNERHTYYWHNGKRKEDGKYVMGRKDGVWVKYDKQGNPIIMITYRGGKETKYDSFKVHPPLGL